MSMQLFSHPISSIKSASKNFRWLLRFLKSIARVILILGLREKTYTNTFYKKYAKNVHSQNGEDGIIEELLKRLEINDGWVCEFGAWDGVHLSNTFALIEKGFKGVFIEGDKRKHSDLLKTIQKYPNITPLNNYVDHQDTENSLDNLLSKTEIPINFDVLSIDIDSYDYQVWKSLKKYRPKIVVIEINSSVNPNSNHHVHTLGIYQGTGFRPTFNLGLEKNYKFVLHTGNMIFVENELFDKLNVKYDNELENYRAAFLPLSVLVRCRWPWLQRR